MSETSKRLCLAEWPDAVLSRTVDGQDFQEWLQSAPPAQQLERAARLVNIVASQVGQDDKELPPWLDVAADHLVARKEILSRQQDLPLYTANVSREAIQAVAWTPNQAVKVFSNIPVLRSDQAAAGQVLGFYLDFLEDAVRPAPAGSEQEEVWSVSMPAPRLPPLVESAVEGYLFQHGSLPESLARRLALWIVQRRRHAPQQEREDGRSFTPLQGGYDLERRLLLLEDGPGWKVFSPQCLRALYRSSDMRSEGQVTQGLILEAPGGRVELWRMALEGNEGDNEYIIGKLLKHEAFCRDRWCRKQVRSRQVPRFHRALLPFAPEEEFIQLFRELVQANAGMAASGLLEDSQVRKKARRHLSQRDFQPLLNHPDRSVRRVALRVLGGMS